MACCIAAAALGTHTGCGTAPPPRPASLTASPGPTVRTLNADWPDVEAAMEIAVRKAELAIVDREVSDNRIVFNLQSVADEPGHLVAVPLERAGADNTPTSIRLESRIGLFGNPKREQALLAALAARLEQLRGREWAPAR